MSGFGRTRVMDRVTAWDRIVVRWMEDKDSDEVNQEVKMAAWMMPNLE